MHFQGLKQSFGYGVVRKISQLAKEELYLEHLDCLVD